MKTYTIQASRNGRDSAKIVFEASNDSEAQIGAIPYILNKAKDSQMWALGEICLHNASAGYLVAVMEQKG